MILPYDMARCLHPCGRGSCCARTTAGRSIMQPYSIFPGGLTCPGFIAMLPSDPPITPQENGFPFAPANKDQTP